MDVSERCRTDVLPFCHLFEFAQDLLGFRSISRNGISVAEESLIPRTGHHYFASLKFRDCSRHVTFPQEAAAQQMTAEGRSGIQFQRLCDLDNGIVVSTCMIQEVRQSRLKERI